MLASGNCQIKLRWAEALRLHMTERYLLKLGRFTRLGQIFFLLFILANKLYELALCAL